MRQMLRELQTMQKREIEKERGWASARVGKSTPNGTRDKVEMETRDIVLHMRGESADRAVMRRQKHKSDEQTDERASEGTVGDREGKVDTYEVE